MRTLRLAVALIVMNLSVFWHDFISNLNFLGKCKLKSWLGFHRGTSWGLFRFRGDWLTGETSMPLHCLMCVCLKELVLSTCNSIGHNGSDRP